MQYIIKDDPAQMNWLRPDFEYAAVTCPAPLAASVKHQKDGDLLRTEVVIKNTGAQTFMTTGTSIGIAFPLEDRYESSRICMEKRCHAHIFCGGDISYICALRMGGAAPHLGMVLTEGSLSGYSVERNPAKLSNDRGCFWLHPSPMEFLPQEEIRISWVIFPHQGRDDFWKQAAKYRPFVRVEASDYVIMPGEKSRITITPSFNANEVKADGILLQPYADEDGKTRYIFEYTADEHISQCNWTSAAVSGAQRNIWNDPREKKFQIEADGIRTECRILVQENPLLLAQKRCHFIAENQQYSGKDAHLCGAYLAYDNEDGFIYYNKNNDYNGGRERVGMGLLLARFLQIEQDAVLDKSLKKYVEYVKRELVCEETGEVCNDYRRNNSYYRWYNMPWFAALFVELYRLYGGCEYLETACRIVRRFYEEDGFVHYPIEMPAYALCKALEAAGMETERNEMTELFRKHADSLAAIGCQYPPSEVNYEQSIVAPAADILLQVYLLTGKKKYLEEGRRQLDILELFNGMQPDYHLYETAIRHWDGYWFGKRKLFGDTFPHYWSALTGNCFAWYAKCTGDMGYEKRVKDSLRSVLSLIFPDGTGSCACVFPKTVNGEKAALYDPYANDQDWGLYMYLRAYLS